jgi:hypothetical protein
MISAHILYFILAAVTPAENQKPMTDFKSERVYQSASFILNGPIDKIFPLFGPVREKEWAAGWNPEIIYPLSVDVEKNMVFQTKGKHPEEEKYTWVISIFNPKNYQIEYTVCTPERIWLIQVQCEAIESKTKATVTYTYTALSSMGNERNKEALKNMFSSNLKDWQEAINYYLETGKQKQ